MDNINEFKDAVLCAAKTLLKVAGHSNRATRASLKLCEDEIQESIKSLEKEYPEYKGLITGWHRCHESCLSHVEIKGKLLRTKDATRRATIKELQRLNPNLKVPTSS